MNRILLKLLSVTALAAAAASAQIPSTSLQDGAVGRRSLGRLRPGRLARTLNLTDTQKVQAKAIFQQARQTALPLRQQLRQNRQALAEAVKTNRGDADIQQLAGQQGSLRGQMTAIRTMALSRFYNLLTPDQRTQADRLLGPS